MFLFQRLEPWDVRRTGGGDGCEPSRRSLAIGEPEEQPCPRRACRLAPTARGQPRSKQTRDSASRSQAWEALLRIRRVRRRPPVAFVVLRAAWLTRADPPQPASSVRL